MGLFALRQHRSRDPRQARLPIYEKLSAPAASKERYSDVDENSSDDDVYDDDCSAASSPSTRDSRHTSSTLSSSNLMLPRRPLARPRRRPDRPSSYRLPNKVTRWLCIGMVTTILIFILSLVRASRNENRRIANGEVRKAPPEPPVWESFEFLTRYYGGVRSLVPLAQNNPQYPRAEDELPYNATGDYESRRAKLSTEDHSVNEGAIPPSKVFVDYPGSVVEGVRAGGLAECFVDAAQSVRVPPIRYYDGRPSGFPDNVLGSYELLSLPEDICFDRYGRYGPYGFGYATSSGGLGIGEHGDREGAEPVWAEAGPVDWRKIDWADAQRRCYQANAARYGTPVSRFVPSRGFYIHGTGSSTAETLQVRDETLANVAAAGDAEAPSESSETSAETSAAGTAGDLPRTAVVIRCWDEYNWREEDIMNLRAVVSELALASGGRYDVHLLVQVKDDRRSPIWADDEVYKQRIRDAIPAEFQGMATLWTETQMLALYQGIHDLYTRGPDLPVHGVYRGLQMAMQFFAYNHPEYEHFWQWEMDIRYTGHYYDLLAKLEAWAREQPRKGLWERNARFYLPAVHGSWEDFKQMVRVQTEMGTVGADNIWNGVGGAHRSDSRRPGEASGGEDPVWGPVRPADEADWWEADQDPAPPTSYERDRHTWGVGEEADLITLNPIFDPEGTGWGLADDITGYNMTGSPGAGGPPRRAQIITASRMSRRLLLSMHRETAFKKHHAFPEMWPATVALHHGYKAVHAPHPLYVDREWPVEYMARILNGGRNGASGGSRTSVFGGREHNLQGLTWFYNSGFSPNLYRRWLGLRVNNDGGEEFELTADLSRGDTSVGDMRGGEGRMCLPPMLIHPVKDVELPVEHDPVEMEMPASDPSA